MTYSGSTTRANKYALTSLLGSSHVIYTVYDRAMLADFLCFQLLAVAIYLQQ